MKLKVTTDTCYWGNIMQHTFCCKTFSLAILVAAVATAFGGCAKDRILPTVFMPDPPKECEEVLNFKVEKLPKGKTTDSQLAVWMAKEGAARQKEHEISRVCAEHSLRTAGVMKDKDKSSSGSVNAASDESVAAATAKVKRAPSG